MKLLVLTLLILRLQVWKQKGEEYRINGQGGWRYLSYTRTYRFKPMSELGLRAGPTRVVVSSKEGEPKVWDTQEYLKTVDTSMEDVRLSPFADRYHGDFKCETPESQGDIDFKCESPEPMDVKCESPHQEDVKCESPCQEDVKFESIAHQEDVKLESSSETVEPTVEVNTVEVNTVKVKQEEPPPKKNKYVPKHLGVLTSYKLNPDLDVDLVDVSGALVETTRTTYPRLTKPSRLDDFLEIRLKTVAAEEKAASEEKPPPPAPSSLVKVEVKQGGGAPHSVKLLVKKGATATEISRAIASKLGSRDLFKKSQPRVVKGGLPNGEVEDAKPTSLLKFPRRCYSASCRAESQQQKMVSLFYFDEFIDFDCFLA